MGEDTRDRAAGYSVNDEGGVDLAPEAVWPLATLLAARLVGSEWMEWENVPNLSQRSFGRLVACMEDISNDLYRAAHSRAAGHNLDVLDIESAAVLAAPRKATASRPEPPASPSRRT